jgi:hypothetical protein
MAGTLTTLDAYFFTTLPFVFLSGFTRHNRFSGEGGAKDLLWCRFSGCIRSFVAPF